MSHLLPKIIKYKDKLFRQVGLRYANCEVYKCGDERILVEPTGEVWLHYTMIESYVRGF